MGSSVNIQRLASQAKQEGRKLLAVLIDPDEQEDSTALSHFVEGCVDCNIDLIFFGGSLIVKKDSHSVLRQIKDRCDIPVVLFPSNPSQIDELADGILFLSLISGRNPELLIGHHVTAAPILAKSKLEVIPTGYMLIDGGTTTTAHYVSQSLPIPNDKDDIAKATAIAGEMLGMSSIYMDAGSGAQHHVSCSMIRTVSESIDVPLIIGGGIRTAEMAEHICTAGADIIVVGNVLEQSPELLQDISIAVHGLGQRV